MGIRYFNVFCAKDFPRIHTYTERMHPTRTPHATVLRIFHIMRHRFTEVTCRSINKRILLLCEHFYRALSRRHKHSTSYLYSVCFCEKFHKGIREMLFQFLIRRPLVLRFEKTSFIFANAEDILFASSKNRICFSRAISILTIHSGVVGTSHCF